MIRLRMVMSGFRSFHDSLQYIKRRGHQRELVVVKWSDREPNRDLAVVATSNDESTVRRAHTIRDEHIGEDYAPQ